MVILVLDDENGFVATVTREMTTKCSFIYTTTIEDTQKYLRQNLKNSSKIDFVLIGNKMTLPEDDWVEFVYINRRDVRRPFIPLYETKKFLEASIDDRGFKTKTFLGKNDPLD